MNAIVLPVFLAMCASGLVVAASWDVAPSAAGDGLVPALVQRKVPTLEVQGSSAGAAVGETVAMRVQPRGESRNLTYTVASGALPHGVSLATDGRISGSYGKAGDYAATVSGSDGAGNASAVKVAFTVLPAAPDLALDMPAIPEAGKPFTASVSAPDGSGIIDWAMDIGPSWLTVQGKGDRATVTGTVPADARKVDFTVVATDGLGRTFYAGSGDMSLEPAVTSVVRGESEASALATPAR